MIGGVGTSRIGVIGGSAVWRRGIAAVLEEAGHAAVPVADVASWEPGRDGTAILVHVEDAAGLDEVAALHDEHPHVPIAVSVPDLGVAEFAAVIKAGGHAAIDEDDPVETVVAVVEHAIEGRSSVPPRIVGALAARVAAGFGEPLQVSDEDAARLRALAGGTTVAQLAEDSGFSEREMFRMLGELYTKVGAKSRTEAILWAERYGILDEPVE